MPEATALLPMLAILLGVGAFAGVLAGLLGVGGGIVLVPAFYYVFSGLGYESDWLMQICLATSLATIIVTSLRSVQGHHRKGAVDWAILKAWAPGIVVGAVIGVQVAKELRSDTLQMIFGALALGIGIYMITSRPGWQLAGQMATGLLRVVLSAVTGFLSVLLGIGGGSLGVPLMTLSGVPVHRAVATAAGWGTAIAIPSVLGFLLAQVPPEASPPGTVGAVNLPAFVVVIAMTLLTTPLGVRLSHATDAGPLKRIFGGFLLLVSANMLWEALG